MCSFCRPMAQQVRAKRKQRWLKKERGCVAGIIDAVNIVATSWHSTAPDAARIEHVRGA